MEIGLHSRDVYQHFLETEKQQEEADIISTSLIVLDRQWSAATGLPPNFQLSDFDYANAASVCQPHQYFQCRTTRLGATTQVYLLDLTYHDFLPPGPEHVPESHDDIHCDEPKV